ncbi:MAG: hypothetical protein H6974_07035 [Gammaproteobacteria bacterium]|nr:hypothetical protein [Gammaproteobacteria bacterium]
MIGDTNIDYLDVSSIQATRYGTGIQFDIELVGSPPQSSEKFLWFNYEIYIDTDQNTSTGVRRKYIGSERTITVEGNTFYDPWVRHAFGRWTAWVSGVGHYPITPFVNGNRISIWVELDQLGSDTFDWEFHTLGMMDSTGDRPENYATFVGHEEASDIAKVMIRPNNLTLPVGASRDDLRIRLFNIDGEPLSLEGRSIAFSTTNQQVISVNEDGTIHGLSYGNAKIVASVDGVVSGKVGATALVMVTPAPVLSPSEEIHLPVSELGAPYHDTWLYGPISGLYDEKPHIIGYPHHDGSLDVLWVDEQHRHFLTQVMPLGDTYGYTHHHELTSLGLLAGFTRDDVGNYYYMTALEEPLQFERLPTRRHRKNVLKLYKLNPELKPIFDVPLTSKVVSSQEDPLYGLLDKGTGRIAYGNGRIMTTFSRLGEMDRSIFSRHQWQLYLEIDATTGRTLRGGWGTGHSFGQRLLFDGQHFLVLSLGDAGLTRGINVNKVDESGGRRLLALAAKGGDRSQTGGGYNNTFTRLGDLQLGENGYVLLFATEPTPDWETNETGYDAVQGSRNLGIVHIPWNFDQLPIDIHNPYDIHITDTELGNSLAQDFTVPVTTQKPPFIGVNKGIVWLTDYTDVFSQHAERPKLVRIASGNYLVLWEKWSIYKNEWGYYEDQYDETLAIIVDEYGNKLSTAKSLGRIRLSKGDDAFAFNEGAAWLTSNETADALILHTLTPQLILTSHPLRFVNSQQAAIP